MDGGARSRARSILANSGNALRFRRGAPWLIGLAAIVLAVSAHAASPMWREAQWSPPIDIWGVGKAWTCTGETCPSGAKLFARTKVGFCNCYTGVADDTEIDLIGDVDIHGDTFTPDRPGTTAELGPLKGRKRPFTLPNRWFGTTHVLSVVVALDCKAVVATIVSSAPIDQNLETAALAVLKDKPFQDWLANQ